MSGFVGTLSQEMGSFLLYYPAAPESFFRWNPLFNSHD
jgi:hypothetical protein